MSILSNAQVPVYRSLPAGHIIYGLSNSGNFATGTNNNGAYLYKSVDSSITGLNGGEGWGVNDNGVVCGNFSDPNTLFGGQPCTVAGVNSGGVWTALPLAPGYPPVQTEYSYAYDIANDGVTVCGMFWKNAGNTRAYIYNPATAFTYLPYLNQSSRANYISEDGTVAAGWWQDASRVPIRWNPVATALTAGEAQGLNFDGSKFMGDDNGLPFVWDATAGLTTIPLPSSATGGAATGITDNGVVIGYYDSGFTFPMTRTAFLYFPGTGLVDLMSYLLSLGCTTTATPGIPVGISRDGRYMAGNTSGFPVKGWFVDMGTTINSVATVNTAVLDLAVAPNPSTVGNVSFSFTAQGNQIPSITIYDQQGKMIRTLQADQAVSGKTAIVWNRLGENGQSLSAGSYIAVLQDGAKSSKISVVLY